MAQKWCPGHQQHHPKEAFGRNSNTPDGLSTYCRVWSNKLVADWKKAHPEQARQQRKRYVQRVKAKNLQKRNGARA